jgi:diaminohydroxyphosphoribosylaminopyrimidine deaminase / 5-amino-6-(5-phosphoribosylamino)uracil reductase
MSAADHEPFMRQAIDLALRGWGNTHPNPMVGAVLVENGRVVAKGYHRRDGGPHAERVALASLGRKPRPGATLYVTLEPCSTRGRTGPCTDAIIASGLKRVVVGAVDPNPDHSGRGLGVLRKGGVTVVKGVLEADCADINLIFNQWIVRKEPLFAGKLAATLDGRIATRTGESKWITGAAARGDVHRWRKLFPAIAVGARTVTSDNPRLTARIEGKEEECPLRFVFDGRMTTFIDGILPKVYTDKFLKRTIVVTTQHAGMGYVRRLGDMGVGVWIFESRSPRVPFAPFRARCASEGITGVLFEGGAQLLSAALIERELDYLFLYHAPVIFGDERAKPAFAGLRTEKPSQSIRLADVRRRALGDDMLVRGRVVYPDKIQVDETLFSLG